MATIRCRLAVSDDKREENRRTMPFTREKFDELKAVFGDGVKVLWAKENGKEIGKPADKRDGS